MNPFNICVTNSIAHNNNNHVSSKTYRKYSSRIPTVDSSGHQIIEKSLKNKSKSKPPTTCDKNIDPYLQKILKSIQKNSDLIDECNQFKSKSHKVSAENNIQPTKKKCRKSKVYCYFERPYSGNSIGHKNCTIGSGRVPKNMGWLWNIKVSGIGKVRDGWKPGAILKPIKQRMCEMLSPFPCDNTPLSRGRCQKRSQQSRYLDIDNICQKCHYQQQVCSSVQVSEIQQQMMPPKDVTHKHKFTMTDEIEEKTVPVIEPVGSNNVGEKGKKGGNTTVKSNTKNDVKSEVATINRKSQPNTVNEGGMSRMPKSKIKATKDIRNSNNAVESKLRPKTGVPKAKDIRNSNNAVESKIRPKTGVPKAIK